MTAASARRATRDNLHRPRGRLLLARRERLVVLLVVVVQAALPARSVVIVVRPATANVVLGARRDLATG